VLTATLKGPRLAPGTRLKIDLEDHGVTGVSGQQPHPIFRPERASPQGISEAEKRKAGSSTPPLTTSSDQPETKRRPRGQSSRSGPKGPRGHPEGLARPMLRDHAEPLMMAGHHQND
jgi:hypothetical protein